MNPTIVSVVPSTPLKANLSKPNLIIDAITIKSIEIPVNFCTNLFENKFSYSPL